MKKYEFLVLATVEVEAENIAQAKDLVKEVTIIGSRYMGYKTSSNQRDFLQASINIKDKKIFIA